MKYTHQRNNTESNNNKKRKRKIIWFNPPFNKNVTSNVAKIFLKLVDKHFPETNPLHKIFNRKTVKVSYSCTESMSRIIKGHNNSITRTNVNPTLPCNCRKKPECPLNGKCRAQNVIYKCVVSAINHPNKVYIGLSEDEWKKRYYNHTKSFCNKRYERSTALSAYVWNLQSNNVTPTSTWSILRTVPAYTNITKRCLLCLHEKLAIVTYGKIEELLNKRSELISKCRHENKYILSNYDTKD